MIKKDEINKIIKIIEVESVLILIRVSVLVILVVQPSGRLVNSLDRIDGGLLQWMDSRFCGPLSALDRVTLSVLRLQQFQPSAGRHQA